MRKIKFRFWLGKTFQGILELEKGGIIDMGWEWDSVDQFTGLLDRLGKEIYEGDITTWGEYGNVDPCGVDIIEGQGKPHIVGFENGSFTNTHLTNGLNEFFPVEILGNLYENPELLKV